MATLEEQIATLTEEVRQLSQRAQVAEAASERWRKNYQEADSMRQLVTMQRNEWQDLAESAKTDLKIANRRYKELLAKANTKKST
jgi:tripartite-type tricarboxylate transporter receptor subunit TctC